MTQYRGIRDPDRRAQVVVERDGQSSPLRHFVCHSPSGIEWGYAGSGPADLARSLLAHHLGGHVAPQALIYQSFKFTVIANLPPEGWTLTSDEVDGALNGILKAQRLKCPLCADQGVLWPEQFQPRRSEPEPVVCTCAAGRTLATLKPTQSRR